MSKLQKYGKNRNLSLKEKNMAYKVWVKFKYQDNPKNNGVGYSTGVFDVQGKSESAILQEIERHNPGYRIIIQEYEWRG